MMDSKCRPMWSVYFFGFEEQRKWTWWWRDWWGQCPPPQNFELEPPLCIVSLSEQLVFAAVGQVAFGSWVSSRNICCKLLIPNATRCCSCVQLACTLLHVRFESVQIGQFCFTKWCHIWFTASDIVDWWFCGEAWHIANIVKQATFRFWIFSLSHAVCFVSQLFPSNVML